MTDSIDLSLIERYLAGACTPDEAQRVAAWVEAEPHRAQEIRDLERLTGLVRGARATDDRLEARVARLNRILDAAHSVTLPRSRSGAPAAALRVGKGVDRSSWIHRLAQIAAVLLLVVGGALGGSLISRSKSTQPFREFATAPGGRTTVTLRDGTRLVLGPASHLRVPMDFGRSSRAVELDGKALFAVVHDARHPFSVRTAHAIVTDVGTRFAVQAYGGDVTERVAVAEGAVDMGPAEGDEGPPLATRSLIAGDVAVIAGGRITVAHDADVAADLSWVQGGLVFHATPFPDVVRQLARTFNLEIAIADSSLAREAITVSFSDDFSADEVLDIVTRTIGARYDRTGRRVLIHRRSGAALPGGRPAPPPLLTAGAQ